jgi:ubiquinone/menaquinone biosynthesis C-methylase UbiE
MSFVGEIVQNGLMWFRPVRNLAKRSHSTGPRGDPSRAREIYVFYTSGSPSSIAGKSILELGPGQTSEVLQLALRDGAGSCSAADILRYLSDEDTVRRGIDYRIYNGRHLPYEAETFDRVWAAAVFQHLRYPRMTLKEIRRVLVPGGLLACRVDLRDTYNLRDESLWAECLKHRAATWNMMKWNRASYVNRLRLSEWKQLFQEIGFEQVRMQKHASAVLAKRYQEVSYLRKYSEEDVRIFAFDAIYRKPSGREPEMQTGPSGNGVENGAQNRARPLVEARRSERHTAA